MALTPLRTVILLVCTLVLSVLGGLLMLMGVHGSQVMTIIGAALLLPSVILVRLGVPIGIPFISTTKVASILIFLGLQAVYYYGLLRLIYFITRRRSHPPAM